MAFGIGTGWSSNTVPYRPELLCTLLRARLIPVASPSSPASCVSPPPFNRLPWFSKFKGEVLLKKKSGSTSKNFAINTFDYTSWVSVGHFERLPEGRGVRVTELPIGYWTCEFLQHVKRNLLDLTPKIKITNSTATDGKESCKGSTKWKRFVSHLEEHSTETKVDIFLYAVDAEKMQEMTDEELLSQLKLKTNGNFNNLHAFDSQNKLRHFAGIEAVLDEFVPERMKGYERRKAYQVKEMQQKMVLMKNRVRFLEEIMAGTLVLHRLTKENLEELLASHGFESLGEPSSFDYLLSMPYWSTTLAKLESLKKELATTQAEIKNLKATSLVTLWLKDLDAFEIEYNSFLKKQQEEFQEECQEDYEEEVTETKKIRKRKVNNAVAAIARKKRKNK